MEKPVDMVSCLVRRKPGTPPRISVEPEDEDEAFAAVPVEQMSVRGVFLLSMAIVSFAAFTLFALSDVLQGETHAAAQWALLLAVPATSAAAWFPISISHAPQGVIRIKSSMPPPTPDSPAPSFSPGSSLLTRLARRYRRNHMFAIYQSVGWTLYGLFVALQLACFEPQNVCTLLFCQPGIHSVQAGAAFIAEVLIISSVLTLERRRDRNRQRRKDRFVVQLNNFNNMLLLVGATLLALVSEYSRAFPNPSGSSVGYSMAAGLGSLALFVTALLNTYGLGGVLSTKDGWNFYQPFMGGARFVLFQKVSWTCFGAGTALQLLYLISLVVVELELFMDQWRKLFPNFYAHILTASVLHQMPLARDILHFYGSREVTRNAFAYTLQNKESVLLVPGGQAEMLEQRSAQKEVRVYTHHKGFIRLAIEHGVPLVPVLSFNEGEMMDNVQAPMMQRWFVKKLAFPFPYFPYGRGLLPIPRKVNIPIVVGEPLEVPHIPKPTQDDVDKVHTKYFAALEEIFVKYKDEVGCGDYKLVFI
ncbi:hypothetical protein BBO99_00001058 [Phytophthora kernoviae]|uniref:Acyltransferase n=1 Tax=Phytophthora kernoviae TaxID=325452 RepID=A0A421H0G7_9STRA|nr:hypothetical protein JM16_000399 [Phytophthora kernoviae]RLN06707.1 hypothetical protein BBI17_001029 [Phytophthora kernoviae]RLN84754.1 hypothetical protein BBO99_00001058 [Phytophthora kernoviae]